MLASLLFDCFEAYPFSGSRALASTPLSKKDRLRRRSKLAFNGFEAYPFSGSRVQRRFAKLNETPANNPLHFH